MSSILEYATETADGVFGQWRHLPPETRVRVAAEEMLGLVRRMLPGSGPDDLITIVDEVLADPASVEIRLNLSLTQRERRGLATRISSAVADDDESAEAPPPVRAPEYDEIDHIMGEVLRLQMILAGVLAARRRMSSASMSLAIASPFSVLDDPTMPPQLQRAVLSGARLDVLFAALHLVDLGELDRSPEMRIRIIQTTISSARDFLALLVYILETETDINPRVDFDLLPQARRLSAVRLQAEASALRRNRERTLDEARHRLGRR